MLISLVSHTNRDVKENASEVFEKYIDSVAEKLEEDENRHKVLNQILNIIREYLIS